MKNRKELKDNFLLKLKKHIMYQVHPLVESYIMELLDEALDEQLKNKIDEKYE